METDLSLDTENTSHTSEEQEIWDVISGGPDIHAAQRSPLTLAYVGDSVMDLIVRTELVSGGNEPVHVLHKKSSAIVNAANQSRMAGVLEPLFTEEEAAVYRRGRNAKAATHAKNASIQDYRRATGLEAVFGYLFLKGDYARLMELYRAGKNQGAMPGAKKHTKSN